MFRMKGIFFRLRSDKKGFLLAEETLKIILAVIGIGFLVFLLGSIYFNASGENKLEHAKAVLFESEESLESVIDSVRKEEGSLKNGSAEEFSFNNPQGWSMFSFIVREDEAIPNKCANKNCVCICNSKFIKEDNLLSKGQARECSDEGACLIVSDLNKFEEIEIERNVNKVNVTKNDSGISIQEVK